ncbi:hypothetical protein VitviT2T_012063 [Vitis vinifera]|uniref:SWIM-type domain-containing protein n=1 Tax=Vitis vinifera TaxID=29760 RepID=A0ABY9CF83_VITVI|nr:hypothetical protein VitviT2T_012063 [Vitis vinifera]
MAAKENNIGLQSHQQDRHPCRCKSFGQKCSHLVKKQRAKFYILRRLGVAAAVALAVAVVVVVVDGDEDEDEEEESQEKSTEC